MGGAPRGQGEGLWLEKPEHVTRSLGGASACPRPWQEPGFPPGEDQPPEVLLVPVEFPHDSALRAQPGPKPHGSVPSLPPRLPVPLPDLILLWFLSLVPISGQKLL